MLPQACYCQVYVNICHISSAYGRNSIWFKYVIMQFVRSDQFKETEKYSAQSPETKLD